MPARAGLQCKTSRTTGGHSIMSLMSSSSNASTALHRMNLTTTPFGFSGVATPASGWRFMPCTALCAVPRDVPHRRPKLLNWGSVDPNCEASWVSHRSSSASRSVESSRDSWFAGFSRNIVVRQEGRYLCASSAAQEENFGLGNFEVEIRSDNWADGGAKHAGSNPGVAEKNASETWVVNFYCFVSLEEPHLEVARHTAFLEGKDVRGRIYFSQQGINAQLSGQGKEAIEYAEWVKEDSRFSDMLVQISPSPVGHTFPRLRLRYKPSLVQEMLNHSDSLPARVQVEGGTLHLPITDPSARAVHLSPREWTERLDATSVLSNSDAAVSEELAFPQDRQHDETSKARKPVVLLDVRNGYEWDVGHFKGAQRPNVDCFKSTAFGLTDNETVIHDPLANVDKEAVDVMMYCTGGIRCDVFSTMLRQKGFKNLYTLKGGVSNYLKEEGGRTWAGNLFVFDSRLAVPPKDFWMESPEEPGLFESNTTEEVDYANSSATQAFARCRLCGDLIPEPRHRNCANLDCNLLYLSCEDCLSQHHGCCSTTCSGTSRLRPLLACHQYDRWHNYRPQEPKLPKPANYVSRRALQRRRRKERRKLLVRDTACEQVFQQLVESHGYLSEVHDKEPNFASIREGQN